MSTSVEQLREALYGATAPGLDDRVFDRDCPVCRTPIRVAGVLTRGRHSDGRVTYSDGPVCLRCYGFAAPSLVWYLAGEPEFRPCEHCSMPVGRVPDQRMTRWTCSTKCRVALWRDENRSASRNATCRDCGEEFTPARSDAAYCSPACRQRAYRRRTG